MIFPALEPNKRNWDPGEYPVARVPARGRSPRRYQQGTELTGGTLTLHFLRREDAEAKLLRDHWDAQLGDTLAFLLPEIVWAGHTSTSPGPPVDGYFRHTAAPQQDTGDDGLVSSTVTLLAVNDPAIP